MKFRHFRRYYFELEYDWDKLDYLQKVFNRVTESLPSDLESFRSFLRKLIWGFMGLPVANLESTPKRLIMLIPTSFWEISFLKLLFLLIRNFPFSVYFAGKDF